jgi:ribulose-5-phosphate 4-epimerase/fuculose-1-phosphate aldolase
MAEAEGIIKYRLDFDRGEPPPAEAIAELEYWRSRLLDLGLVGQDPARYDGYGFGNLSRRWPENTDSFLITASQTGHLPALAPEHYPLVTRYSVANNHIVATGCNPPSSESLTHAWIYRLRPDVRFVFHIHSPQLWAAAPALRLPVTDPAAPYGTPAMAEEVRNILRQNPQRTNGLLAMGGHQDGLIAYGATAEETGRLIEKALET